MAVDLVAIAILGSAGWFFLGLAVAFLCFRAALRRGAGLAGRGLRIATFGTLGVLVLAGTLAGVRWNPFSGGDGAIDVDAGGVVSSMGLGEAGAAVADVLAMSRAGSESELRETAVRFGERMQGLGLDADAIRDALQGIAAEKEEVWAEDAIRSALTALDLDSEPAAREEGQADSLAVAYVGALQAGDSASAAALRSPLGDAMAAGRLARQQEQIGSLERENERLEDELEEESERGLIRMVLRVADEVGVGFGWAGLYFTLFVAFWGGRTPGKRLLGIRIVRLDGRPLGLWAAFNRFGGYAASIFTGLLGFFEMFWDRNRQALHDRIAATVVIRDPSDATKPG
jgi:hypothetical protein